ncbi:MAG: multicopper oxidase family protein [Proteobacteria bacterium]|nr:multicopper oxidase family protein [Pseudomonadota bacterium]MDA1069834.1 multicopper oxidase family protein [Pseudomonadota bacterium]
MTRIAGVLLVVLCSIVGNHAVARADGEPFQNPPEVRSAGGLLEVTLVAEETDYTLGDRAARTAIYNGIYAGPTLRVKPGDTMRITLVNKLDQPTNIHFHGMTVSPLYNGDNVRLYIYPGETFVYEIAIPEDHPPGLFWYHSHLHGISQYQVMAGLSGALIVEGMLDPFPELAGIRERNIVLKNLKLDSDGEIGAYVDYVDPGIRSVAGQVNPVIDIRPGETQFWRISNQSANMYYRLRLDGHTMQIIGYDANRTTHLVPVEEYLIGPSSRVEVLVTGGPEGSYVFRTEKVQGGPTFDIFPGTTLATLVSSGAPQEPIAITSPWPVVPEPALLPVDERRELVFSVNNFDFLINNKVFDVNRVDFRVPVGNVEEWTIRNASDGLHIFHVHQTDFQVVSINGEPVPFSGLYDTITIPIRGEVKVIIPFNQEIMAGAFVFHCHILDHEDQGMMGIVQVYDPDNPELGALPGWAATVNTAMNWVGFDLADLPREVLVDLVGEQAATDYTIGNALCVAPS